MQAEQSSAVKEEPNHRRCRGMCLHRSQWVSDKDMFLKILTASVLACHPTYGLPGYGREGNPP
jgi:hypothetical protein